MKVQPFGNVLTYVDMNGKEVVDYLTAVAQMKLIPALIRSLPTSVSWPKTVS